MDNLPQEHRYQHQAQLRDMYRRAMAEYLARPSDYALRQMSQAQPQPAVINTAIPYIPTPQAYPPSQQEFGSQQTFASSLPTQESQNSSYDNSLAGIESFPSRPSPHLASSDGKWAVVNGEATTIKNADMRDQRTRKRARSPSPIRMGIVDPSGSSARKIARYSSVTEVTQDANLSRHSVIFDVYESQYLNNGPLSSAYGHTSQATSIADQARTDTSMFVAAGYQWQDVDTADQEFVAEMTSILNDSILHGQTPEQLPYVPNQEAVAQSVLTADDATRGQFDDHPMSYMVEPASSSNSRGSEAIAQIAATQPHGFLLPLPREDAISFAAHNRLGPTISYAQFLPTDTQMQTATTMQAKSSPNHGQGGMAVPHAPSPARQHVSSSSTISPTLQTSGHEGHQIYSAHAVHHGASRPRASTGVPRATKTPAPARHATLNAHSTPEQIRSFFEQWKPGMTVPESVPNHAFKCQIPGCYSLITYKRDTKVHYRRRHNLSEEQCPNMNDCLPVPVRNVGKRGPRTLWIEVDEQGNDVHQQQCCSAQEEAQRLSSLQVSPERIFYATPQGQATSQAEQKDLAQDAAHDAQSISLAGSSRWNTDMSMSMNMNMSAARETSTIASGDMTLSSSPPTQSAETTSSPSHPYSSPATDLAALDTPERDSIGEYLDTLYENSTPLNFNDSPAEPDSPQYSVPAFEYYANSPSLAIPHTQPSTDESTSFEEEMNVVMHIGAYLNSHPDTNTTTTIGTGTDTSPTPDANEAVNGSGNGTTSETTTRSVIADQNPDSSDHPSFFDEAFLPSDAYNNDVNTGVINEN